MIFLNTRNYLLQVKIADGDLPREIMKLFLGRSVSWMKLIARVYESSSLRTDSFPDRRARQRPAFNAICL